MHELRYGTSEEVVIGKKKEVLEHLNNEYRQMLISGKSSFEIGGMSPSLMLKALSILEELCLDDGGLPIYDVCYLLTDIKTARAIALSTALHIDNLIDGKEDSGREYARRRVKWYCKDVCKNIKDEYTFNK